MIFANIIYLLRKKTIIIVVLYNFANTFDIYSLSLFVILLFNAIRLCNAKYISQKIKKTKLEVTVMNSNKKDFVWHHNMS